MSVLIGYVPSDLGRAALAAAIDEARWRGQKLIIANSRRTGPLVEKTALDAEETEAVLALADKAGVEVELLDLQHDDDVADSLLTAAQETSAQLIVIGLRKRSQVGKFIMGSLAQRIILQSDVPVLAVKE
jgi:nucleotide-binding universal stress UspA family protein